MRILLVENDSDEHFVNVRNDESKNHQQLSIGLTQRHPHSDISVVQVKDAYEACSKIDNNDFDLVLVDYFHEKKASADDIVNKSIREKKKIVISKISELQKLKEEIRKIQAEVWNCNGKKVAITIKRHILAKNSPTEQIPVALYSRHAKTLMKTHELFPLFEEGIYLAWKPKYFGFTEGDSSEPILKSDFDSENEGELAFLKILFNQVEQEML